MEAHPALSFTRYGERLSLIDDTLAELGRSPELATDVPSEDPLPDKRYRTCSYRDDPRRH
jgi:hypothetical protein